jgi:ABC-type transport system substrate-binding protein
MIGELAEEVRRTPDAALKPVFPSTHWLAFVDQWDPKSPWHDRRVRLAANLAIDRQAINEARTFGLSRITASIVPSSVDFVLADARPCLRARHGQAVARRGRVPERLRRGRVLL